MTIGELLKVIDDFYIIVVKVDKCIYDTAKDKKPLWVGNYVDGIPKKISQLKIFKAVKLDEYSWYYDNGYKDYDLIIYV